MAVIQLEEFLALLRKSGLLSSGQWDQVQAMVQSVRSKVRTGPDAGSQLIEAVAAELVSGSFLTQWQAAQLRKGQSGFVLQQYRLLRPIGRGGMGHVFEARDDRTGAQVAIKVMSRHLTSNQTLVNRFRREIRASSLLRSPHIVRTLDAGRVGKVDFMVMEYVNGDQLDRIAARIPALPFPLACEIARQTSLGLQHAHEQQMVHRDIKPSNLMIDWSPDGTGTVKIMDMGLVRLHADGEEQTTVTRAGQVMGTPDYMSPEQGWNTATVDIRSDIYSLGCTLFRLLAGRVPFPGDNPLQVLMARCSRDAPGVRGLRPEIPEVVDAILRRMTLRDPAARYQTPQEVVTALAPHCQPLTQEALRRVLQEAGTSEAIVLESAGGDIEPADAGYQQFLREMDSGASVDLMESSETGAGMELNATLPILAVADRPAMRARHQGRNITRRTVIMATVSATIALVLVGVIVKSHSPQIPGAANRGEELSASGLRDRPVAALEAIPDQRARPGDTVRFRVTIKDPVPSSPAGGRLLFRLKDPAPSTAGIDPDTGAFAWPLPPDQSPGLTEVPIELVFSDGDATHVIADVTARVEVEAQPAWTLSAAANLWFLPRETVEARIQVQPALETNPMVSLRLGAGQRPGMTIDPHTGHFTWPVGNNDAGRHAVAVELVDEAGQVLAETDLQVIIFPVPEFPEQTAVAGELFRMPLPREPGRFLPRMTRLEVAPGGPPGVTLDPVRGELLWDVPEEASGRHEIRLQLFLPQPIASARPGVRPETVLIVNVRPKAASPSSVRPAEEELEAARKEVREIFAAEIAAARSVADRGLLARRMLDRSYEQTPGAADLALLELATELAGRGRAWDVILEACELRARRYGADELGLALELLEDFRASSLTASRQDVVIEQCVRLALRAAEDKRYREIPGILSPADALLKKTEKGSLAERLAADVSEAVKLAQVLLDPATVAAEVSAQELMDRLRRWQFTPLLTDPEAIGYVQAGLPGDGRPDGGRGLWNFQRERIWLNAPGGQGGFGLLAPDGSLRRYVLRFQLSGRTTTAVLILGAGAQQNLTGHTLGLDSATAGQILTLPGLVQIANVSQPVPVPVEGWNAYEVVVDTTSVVMRLNGAVVQRASVTGLQPGRVGVFAPLERRVPVHVLDLRNLRILTLPD